jgi:UDP-N-acetylmuramate dehydrogenase
VIALCKAQAVPYVVTGNGSNLLVSDDGVSGVVISIRRGLDEIKIEGNRMTAQAGALLSRVAAGSCRAGLSGLEFAAGIPGTVGGAVVMNAGAYGGEMKQVVSRVRVLMPDGSLVWIPGDQMKFGYRTSCIPECGGIVVAAEFELTDGDPAEMKCYMDELSRRRREKQPLEFPSAGSTFKRPEGYFAGKLIMDAGLAGLTVGGAQVSEKHCGFVINRGGATAADVMELCRQVKEAVYRQFGVSLEMEIRTLGMK